MNETNSAPAGAAWPFLACPVKSGAGTDTQKAAWTEVETDRYKLAFHNQSSNQKTNHK